MKTFRTQEVGGQVIDCQPFLLRKILERPRLVLAVPVPAARGERFPRSDQRAGLPGFDLRAYGGGEIGSGVDDPSYGFRL